MTLWNLAENEAAEISSFQEKLEMKYQVRLRELGFDASSPIKCLKSSPFKGPKVFQIGDSVFSLTEDIASQILIIRS